MLQKTPKPQLTTFDRKELIGTVERIERLYAEIKDLNNDLKAVFKEGIFDEQALRILVKLRKLDPEKRLETFDLVGAYLQATNQKESG
jgi:uncharacterized protein (UPF0335 family)